MMRLAFVIVLLIAASPARAQETSVARAETLAEGGKYTDARAVLARWWQQDGEASRDSELRARGLLLRGRLAGDPTTASQDYLTVVLEHPRATHAPEALLRLGQHFLTIGDAKRSVMYLERLVSDYPGVPQRHTALLFLARAQRAAGADAAACKAVRLAASPGNDAELAALVRAEEETACRAATATAPAARAQPTQPRTPTQPPALAPTRRPSQPAAAATGAYALQSGAFREIAGARALAARLERAGHSARVVRTRGSLALVRTGRFRTTQAAVEVARGIRAQGFTAVVVDDAAVEKPVEQR